MRARTTRLIVVFITLTSSSMARSVEAAKIDPVWLARARTEMKAVYDRYETLAARLEEEYVIHIGKQPGSTGARRFEPLTRRVRTARLNDLMIIEEVRIPDNSPDQPHFRLDCDNSEYYFRLLKFKEDSAYAISDYAPGKRRHPLIDHGSSMHGSVFVVTFRDVLRAIHNEDKHILNVLQFDKAKGLLCTEFTVGTEKNYTREQVYLDPSNGWRVVEKRYETRYASEVTQLTYGKQVGGLMFPIEGKGSITRKIENAPPNLDFTERLMNLKLTAKTPEDFRLSAFGLPDPVDIAPLPKPTRWYIWFLAAALVCGALALTFSYWHHRHKARRIAITTQRGGF